MLQCAATGPNQHFAFPSAQRYNTALTTRALQCNLLESIQIPGRPCSSNMSFYATMRKNWSLPCNSFFLHSAQSMLRCHNSHSGCLLLYEYQCNFKQFAQLNATQHSTSHATRCISHSMEHTQPTSPDVLVLLKSMTLSLDNTFTLEEASDQSPQRVRQGGPPPWCQW